MSADELVRVPRLATRSSWAWVLATLVAVLGVGAWVFVTQPENRWAVAVLLPVLILFGVVLVSLRTVVDPRTGTVSRRVLWISRGHVALASAESISLVDNRAGGLMLGVTGDQRGGSVNVPVLALTDHVEKSQAPEFLAFLADQLDAWAPQAKRVSDQLRKQAAAIGAGVKPAVSPLASLVTRGTSHAAKAGGAGGLLP